MRMLFVLLLSILLLACSSPRLETVLQKAQLESTLIDAGDFHLQAAIRLRQPGGRLAVYIEGDGQAWRSRTQISDDPTPQHPAALYLAARDTSPNVVWLARPCQYQSRQLDPVCHDSRWWGHARYSPAVVQALQLAILKLQTQAQTHGIKLLGYSGGGTLAALLASQLPAVEGLETIAGNLSVNAWTTWHHVSPLTESMDPALMWQRLGHLPQRHWSGGQDRIVPPHLLQALLSTPNPCVQHMIIPQASHADLWEWVDTNRPLPHC